MNYRFKQPFLRARNLFRYVPYHVRHTAMPVSKCPRPSPKSLSVFLLFICLGHGLFSRSGPLFAQESAHSPGWVVISVPDYRALRVRAFPAEREPGPPPVDAEPSRGDYDLRVDTDVASGYDSLTLVLFHIDVY